MRDETAERGEESRGTLTEHEDCSVSRGSDLWMRCARAGLGRRSEGRQRARRRFVKKEIYLESTFFMSNPFYQYLFARKPRASERYFQSSFRFVHSSKGLFRLVSYKKGNIPRKYFFHVRSFLSYLFARKPRASERYLQSSFRFVHSSKGLFRLVSFFDEGASSIFFGKICGIPRYNSINSG